MDHSYAQIYMIYILASARDFGTYSISEQRRLRRVCAYAQTRQSLRSSHTQSRDTDEGSDQTLDNWPRWICQHVRLKEAFAYMR